MLEWLHNLPVVWMALAVLALSTVTTAIVHTAAMRLAANGRVRTLKSVTPVMLTPMAVIFGLLVGFLAAQVWSDFDRAATVVSREASGLRTVLVLAASFPGEPESRLHTFVRRHIQDAVGQEWPAMDERRAMLTMIPTADVGALQYTLALVPENSGQTIAQQRIVAALEGVIEARRQRIITSFSRINWVKWTVLVVLAVTLLFTIGILHSDNAVAAAVAMGIFAVGVSACILLLASHDQPFTGEIAVGPELLLNVLPDAR
jgi:hypothetical protein